MWEAVKYAKQHGMLHTSTQRGLISLIPKNSKDPMYIKNWRPLTLLNVDHKILTKAISNRLREILSSIVMSQQTGYMPSRYIGSNVRKLIDMLQYIINEDKSAVLITIDFEKCFDSIDHEVLIAVLEFFNFGPEIISWIRLIYKDFQLAVVNNGYVSQYFVQEQGIHQGCALSGPCFLATAEVLAISIK